MHTKCAHCPKHAYSTLECKFLLHHCILLYYYISSLDGKWLLTQYHFYHNHYYHYNTTYFLFPSMCHSLSTPSPHRDKYSSPKGNCSSPTVGWMNLSNDWICRFSFGPWLTYTYTCYLWVKSIPTISQDFYIEITSWERKNVFGFYVLPISLGTRSSPSEAALTCWHDIGLGSTSSTVSALSSSPTHLLNHRSDWWGLKYDGEQLVANLLWCRCDIKVNHHHQTLLWTNLYDGMSCSSLPWSF